VPDAKLDYSAAITRGLEDALTYAQRGGVRLRLQKYAAAEADFNQAIQQSPTIGGFYAGRGEARLGIDKVVEAENDLTEATGFRRAYAIALLLARDIKTGFEQMALGISGASRFSLSFALRELEFWTKGVTSPEILAARDEMRLVLQRALHGFEGVGPLPD
jgi:tetratricopeptide (TPR) repeat protein